MNNIRHVSILIEKIKFFHDYVGEKADKLKYIKPIGPLKYGAITTRPDIRFATSWFIHYLKVSTLT